jgi:GNAT superfamily N-acetyltransferase
MRIRAAEPADAPALAVLATQLGYPSTPEQIAARLADVTPRPENAVLVAVADAAEDAVVGWIHVAGHHGIETDPFAQILALVVDEHHRGGGTGAALVEAASAWAERSGFRTLRVRSNVVRERTHRFYERLGFARVKTQVAFARPIDP